jgi:hypothetical protein
MRSYPFVLGLLLMRPRTSMKSTCHLLELKNSNKIGPKIYELDPGLSNISVRSPESLGNSE